MSEGVFRTYIVPLTDTNGEDPSVRVWRGCLLCYGIHLHLFKKGGQTNGLV
jgi:hypothetical protein